jgi:hypothetical protein
MPDTPPLTSLAKPMSTVTVRMSRDEWDRFLPALQQGRLMVFNDAIGDKRDIDSAIASGILGHEVRRLETLAAKGPGVTLTWTPDHFGLFVYGLETVRHNASIPLTNSPTVEIINAFIRKLRGTVTVDDP